MFISIHSLRMEGDVAESIHLDRRKTFQSTPSAWRETLRILVKHPPFEISIHSLRMEGDSIRRYTTGRVFDFNPLPPHGGRREREKLPQNQHAYFNPLPPHGGRLQRLGKSPKPRNISIHSLRMEGDLCKITTMPEI